MSSYITQSLKSNTNVELLIRYSAFCKTVKELLSNSISFKAFVLVKRLKMKDKKVEWRYFLLSASKKPSCSFGFENFDRQPTPFETCDLDSLDDWGIYDPGNYVIPCQIILPCNLHRQKQIILILVILAVYLNVKGDQVENN